WLCEINQRLRVVAEGVETLEQLSFLKTTGCHEAQGYYFSRPVDSQAAERFLATATLSGAEPELKKEAEQH
ncbi:MAG: EAL domain-containing protein, partial [Leptolyngbya sp. SIO4C5]|nr:EAL domain-containing protein [Leptolyngbya sp. SIO4C5]